MKTQFLDLGKQPIANGFLTSKQISKEIFFTLIVLLGLSLVTTHVNIFLGI